MPGIDDCTSGAYQRSGRADLFRNLNRLASSREDEWPPTKSVIETGIHNALRIAR